MQAHGHSDTDELSADGPNFLAVGFNKGKIMTADEQTLDEFEAVSLVLGPVTVESGTHDVVEFATNFLKRVTQLSHEAVAWREVVHGDGHDHADSCEDDTVRIGAGFVAGPGVEEGGLVNVAIDPVTIFKVVGDETVYGLEGREKSEKISIVFICRRDFVKVCVVAGLAVAVIRLTRVLKGS